MKERKLYVAYGSNLNKEQMEFRCPGAKPIGKFILKDYKLEFRVVANIIKCEGAEVPIGLWEITDECEKALDRYEGYPKLYRKEYVEIEVGKVKEKALVYVMNYRGIAPPSMSYYYTIKQGYNDFKIDLKALRKALKESYGE